MDVKDGKKITLTMTQKELEDWKARTRADGVPEEEIQKFFSAAIKTGIIVLKE